MRNQSTVPPSDNLRDFGRWHDPSAASSRRDDELRERLRRDAGMHPLPTDSSPGDDMAAVGRRLLDVLLYVLAIAAIVTFCAWVERQGGR